MFTKSLVRVARSSPSLPQSCSTAVVAASLPRAHQRRPSSSKASCPPGGPADQAATNAARPASEEQKRSGRLTRRKTRDNAAEVTTKAKDDAFANLPSVPPTNLQPADIRLSAFFSLHRPISVTSPIPPASDPSSFAAMFEPRSHKPHDVIYTIANAVTALEGDTSTRTAEEKDLRWELVQQSSTADPANTQHNSLVPTLEQLVKQFRPFNTPPPPVPYEDFEAEAKEKKMGAQRRSRGRAEGQVFGTSGSQSTTHKTFTTTLTINEATAPDGVKTYTASASPIIEREFDSDDAATTSSPSPLPQQTATTTTTAAAATLTTRGKLAAARAARTERVMEDPAERRRAKQMILISVKRQRKLKMKKHKYKKLMKRTRNLRRKEGRI